METVLSHIVQKRFSQWNEDIATDALAYILRSSAGARNGMMRLLRTIASDLPDLQFQTQLCDGSIRPDMTGSDAQGVRVFIENKFWAGLTENQPVSYLHALAKQAQSSVVLMIVPNDRAEVVWREATRRLAGATISVIKQNVPAVIVHAVTTAAGPSFALTTWRSVLSVLDDELVDDPARRSDLAQLRALCDSADADAFLPMSAEELTDLRTPRLLLQLSDIIRSSVELAVAEGVVDLKGLRATHGWQTFGHYLRFSGERELFHWLGVHFGRWKRHGAPVWLYVHHDDATHARALRHHIESWAIGSGVVTSVEDDDLAIGIEITPGVDKYEVQRRVVDQLVEVARVVKPLRAGLAARMPPQT